MSKIPSAVSAKTYVITGSEALSYRQATEIISHMIGKPLRFIDETPGMARARREREAYHRLLLRAFWPSVRISDAVAKR